MKHQHIKQRSEPWFSARRAVKITGSTCNSALCLCLDCLMPGPVEIPTSVLGFTSAVTKTGTTLCTLW